MLFRSVSSYVNQKIRELGSGILDGTISVNPYEQGAGNACTYCAYKSVCGFDGRIEGYEMRRLESMSGEDAVACMRRELETDEQGAGN